MKMYNLEFYDYNNDFYKKDLFDLRNKVEKVFKNDVLDDELLKLEDRVYTIDNRILNDKERINIEMKKLEKLVDKNNSSYITDIYNQLKFILKQKDWDNPRIIKYLKESILALQIITKSNITFYSVLDSLYEKENNKNVLKMKMNNSK